MQYESCVMICWVLSAEVNLHISGTPPFWLVMSSFTSVVFSFTSVMPSFCHLSHVFTALLQSRLQYITSVISSLYYFSHVFNRLLQSCLYYVTSIISSLCRISHVFTMCNVCIVVRVKLSIRSSEHIGNKSIRPTTTTVSI